MHKWIWFAVFFGCVSFSLAKPMPPFPMQHIQSNGDTLTFYQRGDEFEHYKETLDGYILVFCDKDLCFANSQGENSGIKASDKRDAAIQKFLNGINKTEVRKIYLQEKMEKRSRRPYGSFLKTDKGVLRKPSAESWTKGEQTFLIVLVNHSLKSWTNTDAENFKRMLNETGYSDNSHFGSVRDYYIRQSGGIFKPTFQVIGPYDYNGTPSGNDVNVMEAVLNAAYNAGELTSLDSYAKNSDGTFVGLVLAGSTADYKMDNVIYMGWMNKNFKPGKVGRYVYIPGKGNFDNASIDGMGTFVHEFGHVLGLPDLYQTNTDKGTFTTPGEYDVMDVGCYNHWVNTATGQIYGTHVPNMSSMEREWLGWHKPIDLPDNDGVYAIPSFDSSNFAYQIVDAEDANQWFVLENRQKSNWDASLPGHGLLIWHIDYDQQIWDSEGVNNYTQYVDIEEASLSSADAYSYPGIQKITDFDHFYNWSGNKIYNKISHITEKNGYICFTVGNAVLEECPPKNSSSSTLSSSSVTSSSSMLSSSSEVSSSSSIQMEQKEFIYAVSLPLDSSYGTVEVALENEIFDFLGFVSSEMANLLGNGLSYFVLNPNDTKDFVSTATEPGNWFDSLGYSTSWENEKGRIFSEIDLVSAKAKIGHYPFRVQTGDVYSFRQGFSYGAKEAILSFQVSIVSSELTETLAQPFEISGQKRIFAKRMFLHENIFMFLQKRNAVLNIYDLNGNLKASIRHPYSADVSSEMRSLKNGVYRAVLRIDGKIVITESLHYLR